MVEPKFLGLAEGVFLVTGPAGGALYDLRHQTVWAIPAILLRVLKACAEGAPFESALSRSVPLPGGSAAREKLLEFIAGHQAFGLRSSPSRSIAPPPLNRSVAPEWLMLEITPACNLRCCHCYMSATPTTARHPGRTLPTSRWLELLQEARELGFFALQITGGEPSVHPDLAVLLRAAHRLAFEPIALFTNLTLLDDSTLALLIETRSQVHTSLYACDSQLHDRITKETGSHARAVGNLQRLIAAGIEAHVGIAVMEENQATLKETTDFLFQMGIPDERIKLECAWPQGRAANRRLLPAEALRVQKLDELLMDEESRLYYHTCWAGRTAIAPDGGVMVCVGERRTIGNVATEPLKTAVESDAVRSLWRITLDDVEVCQQCEFRYACFDCRAVAHVLTGKMFGRDPGCAYDPRKGRWRCEEASMTETPKRRESFVAEEMDDELLLADFRNAQLHVLNPTAAAIWDLCDGESTLAQIAETLAAHFSLPPQEVQQDVARVVGEFHEKGLVE